MKRIGVIADTHGLLRPEAVRALKGVDQIIHAGDIGSASIIDQLEYIAPVVAIRGNIDKGSWANQYSETQVLQIGNNYIYIIHNLKDLDLEPKNLFSVVVCGHSHQPHIYVDEEVLFFNPGSAGPRRFKLPVTLGLLEMDDDEIMPKIVNLVDIA